MESLENPANSPQIDDSHYYTAYIEVDYPEEVNENENNSNLEKSRCSIDGDSKKTVKSIATSTPRSKNGTVGHTVVSPGFSDIEEAAPKDAAECKSNPAPETGYYERDLADRFCLMKMPTEEDAEAIRTTFARGKISPETEIKYRKFLQSSPSAGRSKASKGSLRKNIRL